MKLKKGGGPMIEERKLVELELLKKKLDSEITELQKEINKINKSKLWSITKPLRWSSKLSERKKLEAYRTGYQELKDKLNELERRLLAIEIAHEKSTQDLNLKQLKNNGEAFHLSHTLLHRKKELNDQMNKAINEINRLYQNDQEGIQSELYNESIENSSINDVPEFLIRKGNLNENIQLENLASFKALLNIQAAKSKLNNEPIEKKLDDKRNAYNFAELLKFKRPWISDIYDGYENIPKRFPAVLKPISGAGSRGVYLIRDESDIFDLKHQKSLTSWKDLHLALKRDLEEQLVIENRWYFEQLVENGDEPTRDYKFYTFYGQVGLILEITRIPDLRFCWWSRDGKRLSVEKYDDELFKGTPVNRNEIERIEKQSMEIPLPFIRIDFIKSREGIIFNEFTPYPGNYDEFDVKTDRYLGKLYLKAQNRLEHDFLNGKKFDLFNHWNDR